jgi:hypothetical protein
MVFLFLVYIIQEEKRIGLLIGYPKPSHYSGADNTLSQNNVTAIVLFLLARFMLTGAFGCQAQDVRLLYEIAHSH